MRILQYAVFVIRHIHAQILLVQAIPFLRQILDFQFPGHHAFFQFIADHDVHAVGEFVCLRTDQGRLRLVHGFVEFFRGTAFHLRREQFLQFR